MVSILEALERYRVPHSAAKLMTRAPGCRARRRRKEEGEQPQQSS